jgi:hypothetical protein
MGKFFYFILTLCVIATVKLQNFLPFEFEGSDCTTPLDCYTKALEKLQEARKKYEDATNDMSAFKSKMEQEFSDYQKSLEAQMTNKTEEIRKELEGRYSQLDAKTTDLQHQEDDTNNNLTNLKITVESISAPLNSRIDTVYNQMHTYMCRDVYGGCNEADHPLFYIDRQNVYCAEDEYMRSWRMNNCGNRNVQPVVQCCKHP